MKRTIGLFILAVLLLVFTVQAADTVSVSVEELGLRIDLPTDCSVFTRATQAEDPALAQYGIPIDQLKQIFEQGNIYLDALGDDPAFEFLITMTPNAVKDMSQFDEQTLESMLDLLRDQYESRGIQVTELVRYAHPQAVFFRTTGHTELSGNLTQIQQYYTVHNNQAINFTLQYQGEQIPEEHLATVQAIIDSVIFEEEAAETPAAETEAQPEEEAPAAEEPAEEPTEDAAPEADEAPAEDAETPMLIAEADEDASEDAPAAPAPAKKKGFPTLWVVLGLAAIGAVLGAVLRGRKKRSAPPAASNAVPVTPPAAPTPPAAQAAAAAAAGAVQTAKPAVPEAPGKRVCAACGAALAPDDRTCPYCGTAVQ